MRPPDKAKPRIRWVTRLRLWTPERAREFDEQTLRIEAQLRVLMEDAERYGTRELPAGRRVRLRRLEITRALLFRHVGAADRILQLKPRLATVCDDLAVASGKAAAIAPYDETTLAAAPFNLERLVRLLHLYDEVRRLLGAPAGRERARLRHGSETL